MASKQLTLNLGIQFLGSQSIKKMRMSAGEEYRLRVQIDKILEDEVGEDYLFFRERVPCWWDILLQAVKLGAEGVCFDGTEELRAAVHSRLKKQDKPVEAFIGNRLLIPDYNQILLIAARCGRDIKRLLEKER